MNSLAIGGVPASGADGKSRRGLKCLDMEADGAGNCIPGAINNEIWRNF